MVFSDVVSARDVFSAVRAVVFDFAEVCCFVVLTAEARLVLSAFAVAVSSVVTEVVSVAVTVVVVVVFLTFLGTPFAVAAAEDDVVAVSSFAIVKLI